MRKMWKKNIWCLGLIILILPVAGAVKISEIMYDLPGADNEREWIEIWNDGTEAVNLSGWKLYEAEINHRLTLFQGDILLQPGEYAVIVDKPERFLEDWPEFSGTIFDSSFSLKNSGEAIELRNSQKETVDMVEYSSEWGGSGDGTSLQLVEEEFCAGAPTPGNPNTCLEHEQNKTSLPNTNEESHEEFEQNSPDTEKSDTFKDSSKKSRGETPRSETKTSESTENQSPSYQNLSYGQNPIYESPEISCAAVYEAEESDRLIPWLLGFAASLILNIYLLLYLLHNR